MNNNYLAEIVLPAKTKKVLIGDIPKLFADAIHSGVNENEPPQVAELKKMPLTEAAKREFCGDVPHLFPVKLKADDMTELAQKVWKHLPPLKLPITENEWQPYHDAFMNNPREDWTLDVLKVNPYMNQRILWYNAIEEYKKAVKHSINTKLLKPIDPSTFLPSLNASGEWLNNCFVTLDNLRGYAASLNIAVRLLEQSSGKDLFGLSINGNNYIVRHANGGSRTTHKGTYENLKLAFNQLLVNGRYTLNDAALAIEVGTNASAKEMVNKLCFAAKNGTLKMFEPKTGARWLYGERFNSRVRDFQEVTTYLELNNWLNENEPLLSWRFPEPQSSDKGYGFTDKSLILVSATNGDNLSANKNVSVGRPKTTNKNAQILKNLIESMTIDIEVTPNKLAGSAKDLLDACQRIEKAQSNKRKIFQITLPTFNSWLKLTGYSFKTGRTLANERNYWTRLCVKTMGKIPNDIFM